MSTPYERLTIAVEEVSKRPEDRYWVQTAFATLATNHVKAATSESALHKVIRQVAESGESPAALYGSPQSWAAEKITFWHESGTEAFTADKPWSLKEITVAVLFTGAIFSFLFWIVRLLPSDKNSDQPLGVYLLPAALSLFLFATVITFQTARKKLGFAPATLITALVVCGGSAAIGLGHFAIYETFSQPFPRWLHLAVALILGLVGTVASLVLRSHQQVRESEEKDYQDDTAWLSRFKQELRARGDISDGRVREEISRVQEFAAESGQSYRDEFGNPVAYARSLSEEKKVRPYRLYLYSLLMLLAIGGWGYGIYISDDYSSLAWRIPLWAIILVISILEVRQQYRAYKQAKSPNNS